MAAIGRRAWLVLMAALVVKAGENRVPDHSAEALQVINRMSTALTGGDAAGAIEPFDKACPDYEKMSQYFAALVSAFSITNEADVVDEQDTDNGASLSLDWTMTLSSLATGQTIRREQQVRVEVARRKKNWKIVSLSPVSFFDPSSTEEHTAS